LCLSQIGACPFQVTAKTDGPKFRTSPNGDSLRVIGGDTHPTMKFTDRKCIRFFDCFLTYFKCFLGIILGSHFCSFSLGEAMTQQWPLHPESPLPEDHQRSQFPSPHCKPLRAVKQRSCDRNAYCKRFICRWGYHIILQS
jgi:hypothetical protein